MVMLADMLPSRMVSNTIASLFPLFLLYYFYLLRRFDADHSFFSHQYFSVVGGTGIFNTGEMYLLIAALGCRPWLRVIIFIACDLVKPSVYSQFIGPCHLLLFWPCVSTRPKVYRSLTSSFPVDFFDPFPPPSSHNICHTSVLLVKVGFLKMVTASLVTTAKNGIISHALT